MSSATPPDGNVHGSVDPNRAARYKKCTAGCKDENPAAAQKANLESSWWKRAGSAVITYGATEAIMDAVTEEQISSYRSCIDSCNASAGLTNAQADASEDMREKILEIDQVAAQGIIEATQAKDAAVGKLINENGSGCAQELKAGQEVMKTAIDLLYGRMNDLGIKGKAIWFSPGGPSGAGGSSTKYNKALNYVKPAQERDESGIVQSSNASANAERNSGFMSQRTTEPRSNAEIEGLMETIGLKFLKWQNPSIEAKPSTAVYYNIENILIRSEDKLAQQLFQIGGLPTIVDLESYMRGTPSPDWTSNYPWFWESWMGAYIQQVAYIVDSTIPENAIVESQQYLDSSDGDSAWQQLKSTTTGTGDSDRTAGAGGSAAGSVAGVLKYGAPRFWPLNKKNVSQKYKGDDIEFDVTTGGGTSDADYYNSEESSVNEPFSLQNWGNAALQMINAIPEDAYATSKAPYLIQALKEFLATTAPLAGQMNDSAQCVTDAFAEADDAMNDLDEQLADMGLSWGREADRNLIQDAINNARQRARDAYDRDTDIELLRPEKLLFKEQCFLLSFVGLISEYKKDFLDHGSRSAARSPRGNHKRLPYSNVKNAAPKAKLARKTNASLLIDGDPYGFLNKLTYSPIQQRLVDIENFELSNIQPKIRLFKVIYDNNGNEKEVEITFDSHYTNDDSIVFKTKGSRGVGAGLKYFNFSYDGSNPFSAKKSIKAKLGIFANNFNELLRVRSGPTNKLENAENTHVIVPDGTQNYSYVELALKTAKPHRAGECRPNQDYLDLLQENEEFAKLNFRLKAVVGLSAPEGLNGMKPSDKEKIQQALRDSHVTLNLTPTIHNFDFDEQGKVNFTIEYLAYVEEYFDQKGFNVFADPTGDVGFRAIKRQLQLKTYQRDCGGSADTPQTPTVPADPDDEENAEAPPPTPQDHLASIKEKFAREIETDQLSSVSKLLNSLACSNMIYYINVPPNAVKRFVQLGPFADYEEYIERYQGGDFIVENPTAATVMATQIEEALPEAQAKNNEDEELDDDGANASFNHVAAAMVGLNPNANNIAYFYVSDLIDTVLANIQAEIEELPNKLQESLSDPELKIEDTTNCEVREKIRKYKLYKKDFQRMRVLLGPVEIVYKRPKEGLMSTFVNLGDIPISVKYFVEWLTSKILQREENHYPLARFLNDLFNNLIREFLNNDSCFIYNIAQKVRVNQATITGHTGLDDPYNDRVTKAIKKLKGSRASRINISDFGNPDLCAYANSAAPDYKNLPIICISGTPQGAVTHPTIDTEMNYFVYFAGRTMPTEKQNGIKCEDQSRGIQHYLLGRDKGMVKNIKLQKTQTPGLAEVRFEQDGYDGLRQLRNVYDVQIDSFASVQTFPGTYIYVPPAGFDPTMTNRSEGFDLTDLGIGGYCMIVRSEHEFGQGYANSTIHAKWVASLEDDNDANNHNGKSDDIRGSTGKCGIYAKRHGASKGN